MTFSARGVPSQYAFVPEGNVSTGSLKPKSFAKAGRLWWIEGLIALVILSCMFRKFSGSLEK